MRLLFAFIIVLVAAVSAALLVLKDPGYALFAYGQWTMEMSLSLFVLALVVGYGALYFLLRFLAGVWHLPARMHDWQANRHRDRARIEYDRGMVALAEGNWKAAERSLLRHVRASDAPMLNYLAAARAAQQQQDPERRDRYLRLAHESAPDGEVAVGLTQAELQIAHQQMEQALATLTHLRSREPRNRYVIRLLMRLYLELRDWRHLRDLLPELRRHKLVSDGEARRLEQRVYSEMLRWAGEKKDLAELQRIWEDVPKALRDDGELVLAYAGYLRDVDAQGEAEVLLRAALRRQWNDKLVHLYGLVEGDDVSRQLTTAESWLKDHGKDPLLLLTLGRLCLRNRLWGKARIYLESSIGVGARAETYRELGALLEHMGDQDAAMNAYRAGIALAVREPSHRFPESIERLLDADSTTIEAAAEDTKLIS